MYWNNITAFTGKVATLVFMYVYEKPHNVYVLFFVKLPFPEHARGPESSHTRVTSELSQQRRKRTGRCQREFPQPRGPRSSTFLESSPGNGWKEEGRVFSLTLVE